MKTHDEGQPPPGFFSDALSAESGLLPLFYFLRLVQATQPRGCCRVQALWVRLGLLLSSLVQEQSG